MLYAENCCTFSEGDLIPGALGVLISALGGAVVGYREEAGEEAGSCPHGHERENRKLLGIPGCDKMIKRYFGQVYLIQCCRKGTTPVHMSYRIMSLTWLLCLGSLEKITPLKSILGSKNTF